MSGLYDSGSGQHAVLFCQKRALAFLSECSAYEDNTKGKLSEKSLLNGIMENIEQGPAR